MKNLPWDELVFEKRNRSYGAYTLRKEYPGALAASITAMLLLMTVLIAFSPFVFKTIKRLAAGDKVEKKIIYVIQPPEDMVRDLSKKKAQAEADAAKKLRRK